MIQFSYRGTRYALGETEDAYVVCDIADVSAPLARYQRSPEGWNRAWADFTAAEPGAQRWNYIYSPVAIAPAISPAVSEWGSGSFPAGVSRKVTDRARPTKLIVLGAICVVAVAAVGLSYLAGSPASTTAPKPISHPTAGGLGGKSAEQVMQSAFAAAQLSGSVHVQSSATGNDGSTETATGDVGSTEGNQHVSFDSQGATHSASIDYIANTAYLNGDLASLEGMGVPTSTAAQYANKWISMTQSDAGFASIADGLTMTSLINDLSVPTPVQLLEPSVVDGQSVVGIVGSATAAGSSMTATLYVSTVAPYYPVEETSSGTDNSFSGTSTMTLTSWGETVDVTAPKGAIPASSISGGTPFSGGEST